MSAEKQKAESKKQQAAEIVAELARHRVNYGERTCVVCGCTDSRACAGGCSWVETHPATPTGVCSTCAGAALAQLIKSCLKTDSVVNLRVDLSGMRLMAEKIP